MKKIFIFSLAFLLVPFFVSGAVTYERTPSGYTIENPVSFDVAVDSFSDLVCPEGYQNYWEIYLWTGAEEGQAFERAYGCNASSTLSQYEEDTLPVGDYTSVDINCYDTLEDCEADPYCSTSCSSGINLEGVSYPEILFEVVEGETSGEIVTINSGFISGFLDYIGQLFSDLKYLIILIIGLPLAFWVVKRVVEVFREK